MRNTEEIQRSSDAWIAKKMDPAHAQLLRHLTVRLYGAVGEGRGAGHFTGTGVIVRVEDERTHILTAKHNLRVAATDARVGTGELVDYFRRQIRAEFTPVDGAVLSGAIESVEVVDGDVAANGYDVVILRVAGRPYATAVRALAPPDTPAYPFTGPDWQKGGTSIVELVGTPEARTYLTNGNPFGQPVPGMDKYLLLQFGHGQTTPGGLYGFNRRILPTNILRNPAYLETTGEGYQGVFVFDTTDRNTGLQGDSGGPVFAVSPDGGQSCLVGLHLGANYFAGRVDNDPNSPIVNNAITVVGSERLRQLG